MLGCFYPYACFLIDNCGFLLSADEGSLSSWIPSLLVLLWSPTRALPWMQKCVCVHEAALVGVYYSVPCLFKTYSWSLSCVIIAASWQRVCASAWSTFAIVVPVFTVMVVSCARSCTCESVSCHLPSESLI